MPVISDDGFCGAWQTFAGCSIHYNKVAARLYSGIHQVRERLDGTTYLDGEHLMLVGEFSSLVVAQDAAALRAVECIE
jgi:hypothetical protein